MAKIKLTLPTEISGGSNGITNLSYISSPTQGIVTSDTGSDATIPLADITNAGLLSPADKVKLNNTSNTNSGDQTSIVGITGTKSQFNTAVTDGDILYVGDVTQYTDELAQDAVGGILIDTATIDLTYDDTLNTIFADVKPNSITATQLANNINISEFVNDENYITLADVPSLGYTPENVANKSDSYTTSSTTTYPNTKALVDGLATKATDSNVLHKTGNETKTGTLGIISAGVAFSASSTNDNIAISGSSNNGDAVVGTSQSAAGVRGQSTSAAGVVGISTTDNGIYGSSTSGAGVVAYSTNGASIRGYSGTGLGAQINTDSGSKIASFLLNSVEKVAIKADGKITAVAGTDATDVVVKSQLDAVASSIPGALGFTPENVDNKTNAYIVDGTGQKYYTADYLNGKLAETYSTIVYVNSTSPTTATIFDTANPPITNSDGLKNNAANLYIGNDASTWVYNGSSYVTKTVAATSNFKLSSGIDAGSNKTSDIYREGSISSNSFVSANAGMFINRNGSNTAQSGAFLNLSNAASSNSMMFQLNSSNGLDLWNYAAGIWNKRFTFSSGGNFTASTYNGYTPANDNVVVHLTGNETIAGVKSFSPSISASTNLARGTIINPSLTATANNDVLVGLDIAPSFTNGVFTGVKNYGIRSVSGLFTGTLSTPLTIERTNSSNINIEYKNNTSSVYAGVCNALAFGIGSSTDLTTSSNLKVFTVTGNTVLQNGGSSTDDGVNRLQVTGTVSSGTTTLGNTPPTANNQLTRKDYVDTKAPTASPTFTGTPTAPTAAAGTNTTQIATTAFVQANSGTVDVVSIVPANGISGTVANSTTTPAITLSMQDASMSQSGRLTSGDWSVFNAKAGTISPAFTGTPTAPTATAGTNTTQIATTAFVQAANALVIEENITDGVTNKTTSQNKLFDTFALKANLTGAIFTGDVFTNNANFITNRSLLINSTGEGLKALNSGGIPYPGGIYFVTTHPSTPGWLSNAPIVAPTFVKAGGTSSQYLMADGSVTTGITFKGTYSTTGTATTTFTVPIGKTMTDTSYVAIPVATNTLSAVIFSVQNKTTTTFDIVTVTGLTGAVAYDFTITQ